MLFRERFIVFVLLSFLLSLFFIEGFPSKRPLPRTQPFEARTVQVNVVGAVAHPGLYEVKAGTSIQQVLKLAGLKKGADRQSIYLKKKLLNSCRLEVSEKKRRRASKKAEA